MIFDETNYLFMRNYDMEFLKENSLNSLSYLENLHCFRDLFHNFVIIHKMAFSLNGNFQINDLYKCVSFILKLI